MSNTRITLRRTSTAGKVPTITDIQTGELGLNIIDGKLYSSTGSSIFEIGNRVNSVFGRTGNITLLNTDITSALGYTPLETLSYNASNTDITTLVPGSNFGTLVESINTGHFVIGVKSNDANDGFYVIDKGNATNSLTDPYSNLLLKVSRTGILSSLTTILSNTSVSSSTTTGALVVTGGVGVGGNITATSFTGPLTGNASTATTLETARTFTIGSTSKSFNGSANVAWTLSEIGAQANLGFTPVQQGGGIAQGANKIYIGWASSNSTPQLNLQVDVTNFGSNWPISIRGNASTATTATTLETARTFTIGSTSKSFNGSANVAWTLSEIGAQANLGFTPVQQGGGIAQGGNKIYIGWASPQLNLQVDVTNFGSNWPISISGNASTATTLQTSRTIALSGGAIGTATSFNGSNNITIPVTSLNASNLTTGTVPDACISGAYSGITSLSITGPLTVTRLSNQLSLRTTGSTTNNRRWDLNVFNENGELYFQTLNDNNTFIKNNLILFRSGGIQTEAVFSSGIFSSGMTPPLPSARENSGAMLWNSVVSGQGTVEFINYAGLGGGDSFAFYRIGGSGTTAISTTNRVSRIDISGNYIVTSDKRVKGEFEPINDALSIVNNLKPWKYNHYINNSFENGIVIKGKDSRIKYGFVAQEIEEVIPETVTPPVNKEDLYGMDYIPIIPILTKAIQEQQLQIEGLQSLVKVLIERLNNTSI